MTQPPLIPPDGAANQAKELFKQTPHGLRHAEILANNLQPPQPRVDETAEITQLPTGRTRPQRRPKLTATADEPAPVVPADPAPSPTAAGTSRRMFLAQLCTIIGIFALGAVAGAALTDLTSWEPVAAMGVLIGLVGYMTAIIVRPLDVLNRR